MASKKLKKAAKKPAARPAAAKKPDIKKAKPAKPLAAPKRKIAPAAKPAAKKPAVKKTAAKKPVTQKNAPARKAPAKTAPVKKILKKTAKKTVAAKPAPPKRAAARPKPPVKKTAPRPALKKPQPMRAVVRTSAKAPVAKKPAAAKAAPPVITPPPAPSAAELHARKVATEKAGRMTSGIYGGFLVCAEPKPLPKVSPYSKIELRRLAEKLKEEREQARQTLVDMDNKTFGAQDSGGGGATPGYSIHLAEFASDYQASETNLDIRAMAEQQLAQVDEAIQRLEEGLYGVCVACGSQVGYQRLLAKPFAVLCITCRESYERLRRRQ